MEGNGEGPNVSPIESFRELEDADSDEVDDIGDLGKASTESSSTSCAAGSKWTFSLWLSSCAWLILKLSVVSVCRTNGRVSNEMFTCQKKLMLDFVCKAK